MLILIQEFRLSCLKLPQQLGYFIGSILALSLIFMNNFIKGKFTHFIKLIQINQKYNIVTLLITTITSLMFKYILSLIIISAFFQLTSTYAISALRLGTDNVDNDISIEYSNDGYYLILKTSFQYFRQKFSFCFRHRPIVDISDTSCSLGNTAGSYTCIGSDSDPKNLQSWTLSSDYTTIIKKGIFRPTMVRNGSSIGTFSFKLEGNFITSSGNSSLIVIQETNSFYQILSTNSLSFYQNNNIKLNYISTFYQSYSNQGSSSNIIMQRQVLCYRYSTIYNLLFLGGVYRDGVKQYMIAFVNWNSLQNNFQLWEALSFSKDHASRDMIGLLPVTGTLIDLYSLYATSPYQDTSTNIGGIDSYTLLASSGLQNRKSQTWFYYTQFYRDYDTLDTKGDEIIMFKIKNKYCFGAYFDLNPSQDSTPIPTSTSYKHQMLECFTPDLSIWEENIKIWSWLLVLLFFGINQ